MTAGLALIPFAPLAAWLLLAAGGRRLHAAASRSVAAAACAAVFGLACWLLAALDASAAPAFRATLVNHWLRIDSSRDLVSDSPSGIDVAFAWRFDPLAGWLVAGIALAGFGVAVRGTRGSISEQRRFAGGLLLCVAAAAGAVLAADFLQFYLLWSLLSLAAWRMIDVQPERAADAAAGRALVLAQRLADVGLGIGVFSIWSWCGTFDMAQAMEAGPAGPAWLVAFDEQHTGAATLLAACLLAGTIGRCAQFPIFGWLHEVGKTRAAANAAVVGVVMPVGIYLLARCGPLFAAAPEGRLLAMAFGGMTILLAGTIACAQDDLKPAIAFAAVAQFGFALLGLGTGTERGFVAAVLLCVTHAVAYAVLLAAGEDIAAATDREAPHPARPRSSIPTRARWSFAFAALLVATGLWGEHAILGELWNASAAPDPGASNIPLAPPLLVLGMAGLFLVALALSRAFALDFTGERSAGGLRIAPAAAEWAPVACWWWPVVLAIAAASPWLGISSLSAGSGDAFAAGFGLPIALAGLVCGWMAARAEGRMPAPLAPLARLGRHRFYLEDVFFLGVILPLRGLAQVGRFADWFLIDGLLVGLPGRLVTLAARGMSPLREAGARFYLLSMVLAAAVLLAVLVWRS
ncbi:MAG: proton-conducting transporter membrane subunit [Planctomycetales bacterium]